MTRAKREGDVSVGRPKLTPQQRLFMFALHDAIAIVSTPVSVDQIRVQLKKSDSRVRSHIKLLMKNGYVVCVGKARVKKYVPSNLWLEEIDSDESFDGKDILCIGGACSNPICENMAEDYWRDNYYCRDCIMGHDALQDMQNLRKSFFESLSIKSSAGDLLNCVWPTINEDFEEPEKKPRKRSGKKRSGRPKGSGKVG